MQLGAERNENPDSALYQRGDDKIAFINLVFPPWNGKGPFCKKLFSNFERDSYSSQTMRVGAGRRWRVFCETVWFLTRQNVREVIQLGKFVNSFRGRLLSSARKARPVQNLTFLTNPSTYLFFFLFQKYRESGPFLLFFCKTFELSFCSCVQCKAKVLSRTMVFFGTFLLSELKPGWTWSGKLRTDFFMKLCKWGRNIDHLVRGYQRKRRSIALHWNWTSVM